MPYLVILKMAFPDNAHISQKWQLTGMS